MIGRRVFVGGLAAGAASIGLPARPASAHDPALSIKDLEKSLGARLGVAMRDTGSGARFDYRAGERFPLASTFKALAGAAVLAKADAGGDSLDRRVPISSSDLVVYSPAVEKRVGRDISLAELCEAAITLSDNAAGNLLLSAIGGLPPPSPYSRASPPSSKATASNSGHPGGNGRPLSARPGSLAGGAVLYPAHERPRFPRQRA